MWDVLNRICASLGQAMVVLIRDIEETVCSNYESYDAFVQSFGSLTQSSLLPSVSGRAKNGFVLMGGTSLKEKGSGRTPPTIK